ncbi:PA2778 family cysteine peptidase [Solimonas marina]|uniref:PA2778 family cysteine peptidase n=1 Tax=Solimonas marina TaxID=2714601 RepID=A0A969WB48_9GAMM|nr:PA2778 family cysteine peptidase [Solimonas marina]NKF23927.1 PA2778 family cysteine peptidase [Solimonas marina]
MPRPDGHAVELSSVPFYPQKRYQCGPAALATALGASGEATAPDALVSEVYLPDRKGSLQSEIIAATRRHDRVAVRIPGTQDAIVRELESGQPVLVLLNLGFSWLPVWHYAVVVGYQPDQQTYVLRSGVTERKMMTTGALARSWKYSHQWAVVVSSLDRVPASADQTQWLAAVAPLESLNRLDLAAQGYQAAAARWPDSAMSWTALGNIAARRARWPQAVRDYGKAITLQDDVVARNNRASALGALQCRKLAIADLDAAQLLDTDGRYASALSETRKELPNQDACPADIVNGDSSS